MYRLTKGDYGMILKSLVVFLVFVFVVFQLTNFIISDDYIRGWVVGFGELGIFLISVISGFNVVVPIPIITFVPIFVESGFSIISVIFIITAGMTVGDSLSYAIGRLGRRVVLYESVKKKKLFVKLKYYQEKSPYIPMFILLIYASIVPLPNELIVMPLGFLGYRFINILPVLFAGNVVFNTFASLGIIKIFDIL
jgi:membrane protein YqaA with SNARE-associated domain